MPNTPVHKLSISLEKPVYEMCTGGELWTGRTVPSKPVDNQRQVIDILNIGLLFPLLIEKSKG